MTKEEAIDYFESQKQELEYFKEMYPSCEDAGYKDTTKEIGFVDMAISALKDEWIPIKEREPDLMEEVLLSLRSLEVVTGHRSETLFHEERCYYIYDSGDYVVGSNVLAWMHKPEPYKEDES